MIVAMRDHLASQAYWQEAWTRHIETYLAAPPGCGYWLATMVPRGLSVIELAGGSCRDSRYLATRGYDATGTDFDERTLEYLRRRFPGSPLPLLKENAFGLSFSDKSFDVSFSNGFWVCFVDDHQLVSLLREQERITRKYIFVLVHNRENRALIRRFAEKAATDALYEIRFFCREELRQIVDSSGIRYKKITFHKFGGTIDRLYSSTVHRLPNPLTEVAKRIAPSSYRFQSWGCTERIACAINLE